MKAFIWKTLLVLSVLGVTLWLTALPAKAWETSSVMVCMDETSVKKQAILTGKAKSWEEANTKAFLAPLCYRTPPSKLAEWDWKNIEMVVLHGFERDPDGDKIYAIKARRTDDPNRKGWFYFLIIVPKGSNLNQYIGQQV